MHELATVIRRERWLLGVLLYRLTELSHLLAAREARFLGWASAEVEEAVARVREADLLRSAAVSRLAVEAEIAEDDLTLAALIRVAPEPYRHIYGEHRAAMVDLVEELHALADANRRMATEAKVAAAAPATRAVPVALLDNGDAAAAWQTRLSLTGYEAALAAVSRLALPTLAVFLR